MLFGRRTEAARIDRLLSAAREGDSGVLVLRGEAGIGKTSLLRQGARAAEAAGLRVRRVCGWEPERGIGFAGLSQLVRADPRLLARLPGVQASALRGAVALGPARAADRFGVCAATLTHIAHLSADRPLLLVVDDAHALDTPSLEALAFAARRLMTECVVMLLATRPEPAVDRLLTALPVLAPAPLDERAVAAVVADRTGVPAPPEVCRQLTASTGGNPMALIEVVSGLTAEQLGGAAPMPPRVTAGATAEALFAGRVGALGAGARTLLLLMAVADDGARDVSAAARVLSLPASVYPEAERSGLVSCGPAAHAFTHPLVPAAVLTATPPDQR
uniref:AAA family ATPase n=1 Tax=Streptomyces flavofungini TaxID=68200 RepID=UPI0034E032B1